MEILRRFIAVLLIPLHGLDSQTIWVNPTAVVSVRTPATELLHEGVQCTLQTLDGKLINVADDCDDVRKAIRDARQ